MPVTCLDRYVEWLLRRQERADEPFTRPSLTYERFHRAPVEWRHPEMLAALRRAGVVVGEIRR